MLGQMGAMNMQMIARSFLIYKLTGSAAILGVMSLANALPMMFLSLYGGVMADRVQKKYILIVGQAGSALTSVMIAVALTMGYLADDKPSSIWILVVSSLLQGVIQGFMMPARQAIISEIVSQDQVMNAVALNNLGMNVLRIMAPAFAGILIDLWGYQVVFYFMTFLYLLATTLVIVMPLTGTTSIRGRGAFAEMKAGFAYIRRNPNLLLILLFTQIAVLFSMPYMNMLPVFAVDILKVGAKGGGVLMMFSGIGAIVGSLTLASLPDKKRGSMLLFSSLILGLALIGFSFSHSWGLSVAMIILVGLGQTGRMTLSNALLQTYTEEQYIGRVMSVYMMEFGLTSLSVVLAGFLAEGIGIQWAIGGLAIALVGFTLLVIAFSPRMRKLD